MMWSEILYLRRKLKTLLEIRGQENSPAWAEHMITYRHVYSAHVVVESKAANKISLAEAGVETLHKPAAKQAAENLVRFSALCQGIIQLLLAKQSVTVKDTISLEWERSVYQLI